MVTQPQPASGCKGPGRRLTARGYVTGPSESGGCWRTPLEAVGFRVSWHSPAAAAAAGPSPGRPSLSRRPAGISRSRRPGRCHCNVTQCSSVAAAGPAGPGHSVSESDSPSQCHRDRAVTARQRSRYSPAPPAPRPRAAAAWRRASLRLPRILLGPGRGPP